jgi:hypothetical protein
MSTSSVETQIARLRPSVIFAPHMHKWFLAGAATSFVAAIVFWHPWPLMIAFFLGVVGFSEQRAGPNILSAILAYDSDDPTEGTVSVEITSWSDSETYHAIVSEIGHSDWTFQFIPQGWQPASRSYSARIWRSDTEGRPLLAVVEEGILIPRYDPELVVSRKDTSGQ